jgi:hypothetical protein
MFSIDFFQFFFDLHLVESISVEPMHTEGHFYFEIHNSIYKMIAISLLFAPKNYS